MNQFFLVTHPTCPQNFIRIRPQLFEISCTQTNRQKRGENITYFTFGGGGNNGVEKLWNSLPENIVCASDVRKFMSYLRSLPIAEKG